MKKIFKYMIVGLVACTTLSSCLESSLIPIRLIQCPEADY
ncbi:Uncharacterised protein [Parabacteroides merdae]|nr:Uncharacterised protein [Parabacteroides merdae]